MNGMKDKHYMKHAVQIAQRGTGRTWPNPSVGCVLVKDGVVIAAARTSDGGRPHAETIAIAQAGKDVKGATAYVTLEPCAHEGATPACAKELLKAGIARVVVGSIDPDPRTAGKGIEILREKLGAENVITGILEQQVQILNKGFFLRMQEQRPMVTLKIAATIDGKIALGNTESRWITGPIARRYVHLERSRHDAIFIGIGTVLSDDPVLTVRLPGIDHKTVRVVLDTHLRVPLDVKLFHTAKDQPVWVFHKEDPEGKAARLTEMGVKLFQTEDMAVNTIVKRLAQEGITRLFIEGGAHVLTSFLKAGLYDRFLCFRAPSVIGDDGKGGITALGIQDMEKIMKLKPAYSRQLGEDLLEVYERKK